MLRISFGKSRRWGCLFVVGPERKVRGSNMSSLDFGLCFAIDCLGRAMSADVIRAGDEG